MANICTKKIGLHMTGLGFWGSSLMVAMPAMAQEEIKIDSGNTAWMLTATALVLMMTIPGLALFYGGMVRKMNVLATIMQSFAICCLVSVLWAIAGYSLAFTPASEGLNAWIGGTSQFFMANLGLNPAPLASSIPESVYFTYQMTFAIITVALIMGAVADRMKFSAMLWFTAIWLFLVYVPVAHWVWGGGFLGSDGVLDYAGGTVVHINAGVAGLVAALVLGKRHGYRTTHGHFQPHNLVLSVIGAALLWVGWFGFNAGSAVAADMRAGMAMAVTQVAAAAAALAWMFAEWVLKGKPSILGIISGAVAGLVAITPAAGFVGPMAALIIGAVAGVLCYFSATSLKNALGYDDSLDAFGVHGVGGIIGAVLTGVFASSAIGGDAVKGLIEGNSAQLLKQIYGVAVTVVWTAVVSYLILKVLDLVIGLRVSDEEERDGLDLALHGESVH
jgi:ammonium transporter, Amt family